MRTKIKHTPVKKTLPGESGSAKCSPLPEPGTVNSDPGRAYFMTYQEQIKSPQWQKKRLEMFDMANYTCQKCGSKNKQLHVHHLFYDRNKMMWDYDEYELMVLCSDCHKRWHNETKEFMLNINMHICNTINSEVNLENINLVLTYLEFETHEFSRLLKAAKEYKYPWSHE